MTVFIQGCSQKVDCPVQKYPELQPIDKIPRISIYVDQGKLDANGTAKAIRTIKALRVSEHYYYTTLSDYMREFGNVE